MTGMIPHMIPQQVTFCSKTFLYPSIPFLMYRRFHHICNNTGLFRAMVFFTVGSISNSFNHHTLHRPCWYLIQLHWTSSIIVPNNGSYSGGIRFRIMDNTLCRYLAVYGGTASIQCWKGVGIGPKYVKSVPWKV
jgi:hypothetical protein